MITRQVLMLTEEVLVMQAWLNANVSVEIESTEHQAYTIMDVTFSKSEDVFLFDLRWPNHNVFGTLDLGEALNLRRLPDGLQINGHLWLDDCTLLESLPNGLHIGGSLNLTHCTSLTTLLPGLRVQGNLYLHGCPKLTSLPPDLYVGRDLCDVQKIITVPTSVFVGGKIGYF